MKSNNELIKKNSDDLVLLITGCIDAVTDQPYHAIKDCQERLKQYVDSILFYINDTNFVNIVFCDNSNYRYSDLDMLVSAATQKGKKLEWLTFSGNSNVVKKLGKGFGEDEILQYAINNSRLLSRAKSFIKITGRIIIRNIDNVFSEIRYGQNYFNREIAMGRKFVCTRYYCCDKEYFQRFLLNCYKGKNEYADIESLYFNILNGEYRNTFEYPLFEGKAGATGKDLENISITKRPVFNFLCRYNLFNYFEPMYIAYKKVLLIFRKS